MKISDYFNTENAKWIYEHAIQLPDENMFSIEVMAEGDLAIILKYFCMSSFNLGVLILFTVNIDFMNELYNIAYPKEIKTVKEVHVHIIKVCLN